jgi:hypothetical protein
MLVKEVLGEISGSHGDVYEDDCLLRCCAMYGRNLQTCQRFLLLMGAARTSETSVNFHQTTRCNNREDSHLQGNPCSKITISCAWYSKPARIKVNLLNILEDDAMFWWGHFLPF